MGEKFTDKMRELFQNLPLRESVESDIGEGGFEVEPLEGAGAASGALLTASDHKGQLLAVPMTESPYENTRGKKMVPVAVPKGFEAGTFKKVLSAAYRVYLETGRLVVDDVARLSGVDKTRVVYLSQQEEFAYALAVRGIDTENTSGLTPEQDAALLILTDTSLNKTWNQRMRLAGLSQAKYNAWMKNPTFARAMGTVSEQLISNANVALVELARKAGDGDLKAIDRQLAISGRYDPNQQSTIDSLVLVNRLMEVLAKHLSGHPDLLMAISSDMREIGQEISQVNRQQIIGG